MIGDVRNHRDMRAGVQQDRLVDPLHVGGDEARERLGAAFVCNLFKGNDDAQDFALRSNMSATRVAAAAPAPKLGRWRAPCNLRGF